MFFHSYLTFVSHFYKVVITHLFKCVNTVEVYFADDDNKENQANGKLESPVKWSTQNGSDSGTYAEIGNEGNSNASERNILDPADSSEEEVPLPDATSPGRSSDGPEPRADITATLDGGKILSQCTTAYSSFLFEHYKKLYV